MKFDYIIGNPPYQEEKDNNDRKPPIYHLFLDECYKLGNVTELITPGRFLFNAGQTPKSWNAKMLNDEHLKVLLYENKGSNIFPNTDIKGGVTITLRNENKVYGKIGTFTTNNILNSILKERILSQVDKNNFSQIAYPKSYYGLTDNLYIENPSLKNRLTKGNEFIIDASIFDKMPEIFISSLEAKDIEKYIIVNGRQNNKRVKKYVLSKYIKQVEGLKSYKVFLPGANGSGNFGEELSTPFIAGPNEIATQTYMTFGFFKNEEEAKNCLKYIKTKLCRCLLNILKVTQNNPKGVWKYVPLQDFTASSDINWDQPISDIDKQLYKKYGLSEEEINFIETHVKEME